MPSMTQLPVRAESDALALTVLPLDEPDENVARLRGHTLYVNPTATVEDQLWALEEAARYLRTGDRGHGRPVRHLRLVTAGGAR